MRRRLLIAAFGDPGHAFPAIALGRELVRRGHEVWLETWSRWRPHVEREGMRFAPAPEYQVFPSRERALKPYEAAVRAVEVTSALIREVEAELVVADILTVAGALAAERERRPWATLVPHLLPTPEPGFPPFSSGARLPRTRAGRALWRALDPVSLVGARLGRDELNGARARVGLPPLAHLHGGISRRLALVGTFPQLEYPRREPDPAVRITGPLLWEPPCADVEPPARDRPLVLVAPSTSQDPEQRLLAAALAGLADEPVWVLGTTGGRALPDGLLRVPANARLVDWCSYERTMPLCSAVVCHGGHGTVARALACGVPVVASPAGGDMAENAARVAWFGAGVSLPRRLASPLGVRLAVRKVLRKVRYRERARQLERWGAANDGAEEAARAVERLLGVHRTRPSGSRQMRPPVRQLPY